MDDAQSDSGSSRTCDLYVQLNTTATPFEMCDNQVYHQWAQWWQWYAIAVYIVCFVYLVHSLVAERFRVFNKCGARQSAMILNILALVLRVVWVIDAQDDSVLPSFLSGWARFVLLRVGWGIITVSVLLLMISWGGVATRVHLVTAERSVRHRVGLAGSRAVLTRSNKRRRTRGLAVLAFLVVTLATVIAVSLFLDDIWFETESYVRDKGSLTDYLFGDSMRDPMTVLADVTLVTFWMMMFIANVLASRVLYRAMSQFKEVDIEDRPMVEAVMRRMRVFAVDSVLLLFATIVFLVGKVWLGYDTFFFRLVIIFCATTLEGAYLCSITYGCEVSDYSADQPVEFVVLVDGKLPTNRQRAGHAGHVGGSDDNDDGGALGCWKIAKCGWGSQSAGCWGLTKCFGWLWCGCLRRNGGNGGVATDGLGNITGKQMVITQNPLR
jgi:hypothetical protein